MEGLGVALNFYDGKRVLITGHTGFKGAWLSRILQLNGAIITGYALPPLVGSTYNQIVDENAISSYIGDIRDYNSLIQVFTETKPEVIFHLAAQPLVLDAYELPAYTFDVNIQGTVNLLECVRQSKTANSVVVVTTDKVYRNNEWIYAYRENDILGDTEPYAASKACAELVVDSYYNTFLFPQGVALSTTRAGNVIGGGDISKNRIIPDCIRAAKKMEPIIVRNPFSVRPYQHVLEPLFAYLLIAQRQIDDIHFAGQYNVGPNEMDCISTARITEIFCKMWGNGQTWQNINKKNEPHESGLLKLDCSKISSAFGWRPVWDIKAAIKKTIEWEQCSDKKWITDTQIIEYRKEFSK